MTQRLTDAVCKRLSLPNGKVNIIHFDSDMPGFGLRISTGGARSFVLNYRVRGTGRERRYTIGRFPNWTTAAARTEARRLRQLIDQGGDPLGDIEAERAAPTVADLARRFEDEHLPRLRPGSARHYYLILKNHIVPHFGHTKVSDVKFADCDALHRKITKAGDPYAANRTKAVLTKMFNLAIRWGLRGDNPASPVEANTEPERKRYASAGELVRLTAALARYQNKKFADIIRLLLLTGARRGEVRSMRWADLNLTEGIWTKPGATTKQKTDHVVPLSAPARQLLSEIHAAQRDPSEWVFPSVRGDGHVIELQGDWVKLCRAAGITGLRAHDLRHTFASQLASSGASLPLIGALLGHAKPSTTARYAHLYQDPQRAAVERVAAVIAGAEPAEVVPLPDRRRG
jgi:integrase